MSAFAICPSDKCRSMKVCQENSNFGSKYFVRLNKDLLYKHTKKEIAFKGSSYPPPHPGTVQTRLDVSLAAIPSFPRPDVYVISYTISHRACAIDFLFFSNQQLPDRYCHDIQLSSFFIAKYDTITTWTWYDMAYGTKLKFSTLRNWFLDRATMAGLYSCQQFRRLILTVSLIDN